MHSTCCFSTPKLHIQLGHLLSVMCWVSLNRRAGEAITLRVLYHHVVISICPRFRVRVTTHAALPCVSHSAESNLIGMVHDFSLSWKLPSTLVKVEYA
jgi:hypothetical protein